MDIGVTAGQGAGTDGGAEGGKIKWCKNAVWKRWCRKKRLGIDGGGKEGGINIRRE